MGEDFEPQSNTTSEALDYSKKMPKGRASADRLSAFFVMAGLVPAISISEALLA